MISGTTALVGHLGFPTHTFTSPLILNPWFDAAGIDAAVVPMGSRPADYPAFFRGLFTVTNLRGALVTMPHKVTTMDLVDEVTAVAAVAGATNAVVRLEDGSLLGGQFDGTGFVQGLVGKGFDPPGRSALVVGAGGVGSAIAASLAAAGVAALELFDPDAAASSALAGRLAQHFPEVSVTTGSRDPQGFDLVVNATPLGMHPDDPLPVDVDRVDPGCHVGDVVLSTDRTPLLVAAQERGCTVQPGSDMLFEMLPAIVDFFGLGSVTAAQLRGVARLRG